MRPDLAAAFVRSVPDPAEANDSTGAGDAGEAKGSPAVVITGEAIIGLARRLIEDVLENGTLYPQIRSDLMGARNRLREGEATASFPDAGGRETGSGDVGGEVRATIEGDERDVLEACVAIACRRGVASGVAGRAALEADLAELARQLA